MNADRDKKLENKVILAVEMQDLIDAVSKTGGKLSLSSDDQVSVESEEIKKAWFKHLLVSLEKINDTIDEIRRTDIVNIKKELKEDILKLENILKKEISKNEEDFKKQIDKIEKNITKQENSLNNANDRLETYKTNIIGPMNEKVIALTVKMSMIGFISGTVASVVILLIKEFFLHR